MQVILIHVFGRSIHSCLLGFLSPGRGGSPGSSAGTAAKKDEEETKRTVTAVMMLTERPTRSK